MPEFDLNTVLAGFLKDLQAGVLGSTYSITAVRPGDGSASAPSYSFASQATTGVFFPATSSIGFSLAGTEYARFEGGNGNLRLRVTSGLEWASSAMSTPDVSLSRGAANRLTLAVGDVFNLAPTAFASLPAGAEGDIACVTDSNTAVWGAAVAGGGVNNIIAMHNGTAWKVMGA